MNAVGCRRAADRRRAGNGAARPAPRPHNAADPAGPAGGKGLRHPRKQGRGYLYTAALTRAAYLSAESRSLWGRLFGGSPRNFVAALAETDTLTDADIDELAEYLEELKKERK